VDQRGETEDATEFGDDPTALLIALRDAPDERTRAASLTAAFQHSQAPAHLLQDLLNAGLPDDLLRCAVAARLLWAPSDGNGEREASLGWLAASAWRRQDFVEAAVLRTVAGDGDWPGVPSPAVTAAFAVLGTPSFGETVANAFGCAGTDRACLAVAGALALAVHGDPTGAELMNDGAGLPSDWSDLLHAVADYWSVAYEPLPFAQIRPAVDAGRYASETEERWLKLEGRIDRGEQKAFAFASGKRTRGLLYAQGGPLGQLRGIAQAHDATALRQWLAERRDVSVDDFLDNATRDATGRDDQLFEHGTRDEYVRRLEAIFSAAYAVRDIVPVDEAQASSPRLKAASDLAELVATRWQELNDDAATQQEPLRTALDVTLEQLALLKEWRS
jgi:hypothetical protein